jgi:ATP synthase I chain
MAEPDDIFHRTAARVMRTMLLVAMIGSLAALWRGWTYGGGFALGAWLSWLNFRWLRGFIAGLGPGGKPSGFMLFFGLRYLLLACAAYVILKYSKLSLPAMLAGLLVSLAAVVIEILIELGLGFARRDLDR